MGYDVIVVGGGIIGQAITFRLATAGFRVALVEAGVPGGQATRAAAGILSPAAEAAVTSPLWPLMRESLRLYPEWVTRVEQHSGIRPELFLDGVLITALESDAADLARRQEVLRAAGVAAEWWSPTVVADHIPGLAPLHPLALWIPGEGQIEAPRWLRALTDAARHFHADQFWGEPVVQWVTDATGRWIGVKTPRQTLYGERMIVATGAWTYQLWSPGLVVKPIRGQVAALRTATRWTPEVVFFGHGYLVPKADGRLIIGATEDDAGYDTRVTLEGIQQLGDIARRFRIDASHIYWERSWAGLRPATPDGLPILGPVPGHDEAFLATGHYRNGILLAPVTGELAALWVEGHWSEAAVDIRPFRPGRFQDMDDNPRA